MSSVSAILEAMKMKIHWTAAEQGCVKDALKQLLQANRHPRQRWAHLLYVAQREVLPAHRWRNKTSLVPAVFNDSRTQEPRYGSAHDIVFDALRELNLIPKDQRRVAPLPRREGLRVPTAAAPEDPAEGHGTHPLAEVPSYPNGGGVAENIGDRSTLGAQKSLAAPPCSRPAGPVSLPLADNVSSTPSGCTGEVLTQTVTEAEDALSRLKELQAEHANVLAQLRKLEEERAESRILARLDQLGVEVRMITEFITSHGYRPRSGPGFMGRVDFNQGMAA